AYELMLSESQERMLLVVEKGREQEFIDVFARHDVTAVAIGEVIEEKTYRIKQHDKVVAEVTVDALAEDTPVYHMLAEEATYFKEFQQMEVNVPQVGDYTATLKQLLQQPTIASKEWVYEQFDATVQGNTIAAPGSDAAVVRIDGTDKSIAIT